MDKLLSLIADAAERLGIETVRLWPQVVAIHWLKSLVGALGIPIGLFAGWYTIYQLFKRLQIPMPAYNDPREVFEFAIRITMGVLGGVATLVFTIAFFAEWPSQLAGVFWPEASLVLKTITK